MSLSISKLPLVNKTEKNEEEEEKERDSSSPHPSAASLHSAVLQRPLTSLDNPTPLGRLSRQGSAIQKSTMENVNHEAPSTIGEHRKPSAGRMHGNLRLPWNPKDNAVVVGSTNRPFESCSVSLPGHIQSAGVTKDRWTDKSKSNGQVVRIRPKASLRTGLQMNTQQAHSSSLRLGDELDADNCQDTNATPTKCSGEGDPLPTISSCPLTGRKGPSLHTHGTRSGKFSQSATNLSLPIDPHRSHPGPLRAFQSEIKMNSEDYGATTNLKNPQTPTSKTPLHGFRARRPLATSGLRRRSIRHHSSDNATRVTAISDPSQSIDFPNNSAELQNAINRIASTNWEDKVEGLLNLSELALEHPTALLNSPDAHSAVIQAVTFECKNLRSQVSRQAVKTLADLFRGLGRLLDPYVDTCVRVLLIKTGDASAAFLRREVAIALGDLVRSVNPNRALIALLQHGLDHKNVEIRRQCAIQASYLAEYLGAGRIMQPATHRGSPSSSGSTVVGCGRTASAQDSIASANAVLHTITSPLILALGKFLLDGDQDTRYCGRRILATLQKSPDFERILTRHLSGQLLQGVREAADYLRKKGLGEPPASLSSASSRTTVASGQVNDP